jgi:hypothetical protein
MARDLLLQDGDTTPLGAATATAVDDSYFTGARPPECSAALLFKGSPLLSPGSSDRAESAYRVGGPALYAESVDVYDEALKAHDVVSVGFSAVARCHGEAIGVSRNGEFRPMRLSFFGTTDDGVLVWTMTRPDWTCDYGLVVLPRVGLMLSACDTKPGFLMTDWASKRRAQVDRRTARRRGHGLIRSLVVPHQYLVCPAIARPTPCTAWPAPGDGRARGAPIQA